MLCEIRSFIGTRTYQEDAAEFCETEQGLFAAVCDGVGSRADGGASSRLCVSRFIEAFQQGFSGSYPAFIVETAERIDREIYETFGERCGTTAVTVYLSGNALYWLSVGDSRLYIFRNGRLKQITTDHDYAYVIGLRLKKNLIDAAAYQAEQPKGSRLASYFGMNGIDIVDVSMQPLLLEQNDLLLLTTDGLYKKIGDEQIADILRLHPRPDAAADCLIQAVRQSEGATDNTTVAVIGYDMEEQK